jgi:hypothetical protein
MKRAMDNVTRGFGVRGLVRVRPRTVANFKSGDTSPHSNSTAALVLNVTIPLKQFFSAVVQQQCQHRLSSKESRDESNENLRVTYRSFACFRGSARPGQR